MLKFGLFGHSSARQFEYKPRYFDPEKEARDERRRQLLGADSEVVDPEKEYHPGEYVRRSMYVRRGIGVSTQEASSGILKRVIMVIVAAFAVGMVWMLT